LGKTEFLVDLGQFLDVIGFQLLIHLKSMPFNVRKKLIIGYKLEEEDKL